MQLIYCISAAFSSDKGGCLCGLCGLCSKRSCVFDIRRKKQQELARMRIRQTTESTGKSTSPRALDFGMSACTNSFYGYRYVLSIFRSL